MYYFKSVMQWMLTIVIGSLLAAYIESQYFNDFVKTGGQLLEATLGLGGYSIAISGILSIPAAIVLIYIRYYNKTNDLSYAQSRNRILIAHTILSLIAFISMYAIDSAGDGRVDSLIVIFSIVYPVLGHIIWYIGERTETHRIEPSLIR